MQDSIRYCLGLVTLIVLGGAAGAVTGRASVGAAVVTGAALAGCGVRTWQGRAAAERLRLLESAVVHARDAVVILDAEAGRGPGAGRPVLFVNAAFTRMTGYAAGEVVGRSLHLLRGPATCPATLDALRAALSAGVPHQAELLNYRKDGSELWVELSLVPVAGGAGRRGHWVMIQRDIGDRKRADAELRRREEQLRAVGDNIPDGCVYQARQGADGGVRFDYLSAGVEKLLGLPAAAIVAEPWVFHNRCHPDDLAKLAAAEALTVSTRAPFDCEFRVRHLDGDYRTVHCRSVAESLPAGGVRWNGVMTDTTGRHRLEAQLRQAQKMETVGRLAGGVAHDFNNILTGVIGNLDLVELDPADPAGGRVAAAQRAALRAADVTRKLLGFARQNQLLVAPVDVAGFAADVVEMARAAIDPRVRLRAAVPAGLPPVAADAGLLHQALLNLVLNARDALPHGGLVSVAAAAVTVTPAQAAGRPDARPGGFVVLSVTDDGCGMAADVRARVFEPFFTTKPVGQGTGLGLAMVHGIVQQHAGWVECESAPGRGTRFDLYLPQAGPDHRPPPPVRRGRGADTDSDCHAHRPGTTLEMPSLPSFTGTVLLADDEDTIRAIARTVLEGVGFHVVEAADGLQAIDLFRRHQPAITLVVLDLMMPGASGRQVFEAVTALDPGARVLFSSGYSADDLSDLAGSAGLLPKPYRPADLIAAVEAALGGVSDGLLQPAG